MLLDTLQGIAEFRRRRPTQLHHPRANRKNAIANERRVATILVFFDHGHAVLRCVKGAANIATKGVDAPGDQVPSDEA